MLLSAILAILTIHQANADENENPSLEQKLLATRGLTVSPQSIRTILGEALPIELAKESVPQLIQALGSEAYAEREAAMKKILLLPVPPIELLERAQAGDDLEIRMRATRILKRLKEEKPVDDSLTYACLLIIRSHASLKMAGELLQLAPHWTHPAFRRASWLAMEQTATLEDLPRLKDAIQNENEAIRAMALVGLLAVNDKSKEKIDLLEMLESSEQSQLLQFVLVQNRLEQGDLETLPSLVDFCHSEDASLKCLAIHTLHRAFDCQKVSKEQLLVHLERRPQDQKKKPLEENADLDTLAKAAWDTLLARVAGKGLQAPTGWADYISSTVIHGTSEGQPTAFASKIPTSLLSVVSIEKRTANTLNSVNSRHGTSPWLYPTPGKNEAPQVLCENGSWYFPIFGTWRQHWGGGWTYLDEKGQVIRTDSQGGPHLESEVDYYLVPINEQ